MEDLKRECKEKEQSTNYLVGKRGKCEFHFFFVLGAGNSRTNSNCELEFQCISQLHGIERRHCSFFMALYLIINQQCTCTMCVCIGCKQKILKRNKLKCDKPMLIIN